MLVLSQFQTGPLLQAREKGKPTAMSSPDLGVTRELAHLDERGVTFEGGTVSWETVEAIDAEPRKAFLVEDDEPTPIQRFSEETGWMRVLLPTPKAPTTLISGVPMHRIVGTDPISHARAMVKAIGPFKGRALDTATGLGYTAIELAKTATEVVTVELDPAAIELARLNPWSRGLFDRPNVRQEVGDAFDLVNDFPAGGFGAILHDPPTTSLGGDLYGEEFYRRMHRLLARRGRLFHYIGDPNSAHGKRTFPGVMRRLAQAGFTKVERHPEAFGVSATVGG